MGRDLLAEHANYVVRQGPTGLTREVWEFHVDSYPPRLFVQSYLRQDRMTKRHAWTTVAATNTGRYSALGRIDPEHVTVPSDVRDEFLQRLAASCTVRAAR